MQGRGGGWQYLKIDAIFLDFGDTFLKPDFGGCCAVEEAGVEGACRFRATPFRVVRFF